MKDDIYLVKYVSKKINENSFPIIYLYTLDFTTAFNSYVSFTPLFSMFLKHCSSHKDDNKTMWLQQSKKNCTEKDMLWAPSNIVSGLLRCLGTSSDQCS